MEEDIDRLRGDGIIYGYDQIVAAVMIPFIIGDMVICAILDTGATVSILSGRVGRLLARRSGGRLTPTNVARVEDVVFVLHGMIWVYFEVRIF